MEEIFGGHPLKSNEQLLTFDVKSKDVKWDAIITPLKPRGRVRYFAHDFQNMSADRIPTDGFDLREVLVCHDMMGNYRHDSFFNSSTKWDDYRFYHWAGIDHFCYFSHTYITIPPSGWINAAHLHGVRVLGTFITEGAIGEQLLSEVIQTEQTANEAADALVRLCTHFCFDGWFLNIESNVKDADIPNLVYFLKTLKSKISDKIPYGITVVYDSVRSQAELTKENVQFLTASNGLFLNYFWNKTKIQRTAEYIQNTGIPARNVYFGIDIFRPYNNPAEMKTHETLSKIPAVFSVALFAPGWTFQSLEKDNFRIGSDDGEETTNEEFLRRNDFFWNTLWSKLRTHSYVKLPFHTDFCLGSGKYTFYFGKRRNERFFNLSRQSIQPSVPLEGFAKHCFDHAVTGGSSLKLLRSHQSFRLFATDFLVEGTLIFAYASKTTSSSDHIDCILNIGNLNDNRTCKLICGDYRRSIQPGTIYLAPVSQDDYPYINRMVQQEDIHLNLPFTLNDNWIVRYFCTNFRMSIFVQDIGAVLKKTTIGSDAYLGAIYLHCTKVKDPFWDYVDIEYAFSY